MRQGGVDATLWNVKFVVKRALELLATQVIVVHNHPSGTSEPSGEDIALTQQLKQGLELFDITLIDHLIFSYSGNNFSFRRGGLL